MQPHLKHVPGYLMPRIAAVGSGDAAVTDGSTPESGKADGTGGELRVPFHKPGRGGRGGARGGRGGRGGSRGGRGGSVGGKRADPLKGGRGGGKFSLAK